MNIMSMVTEQRTFGIEIEFSGAREQDVVTELRKEGLDAEFEGYTHRTTPHWKLVTDSSVDRIDGGRGLELVSPILKGLDGINQLNKACIALERVGAKVNASCGLHIHLDARDLELKDWKNILVFYYNYQRSINKMLPESRRDNDYCEPWREDTMKNLKNLKDMDSLFNALGDRYRVINLSSYMRHGTIEFRQHSGTVDFEKITEWLQFCLAVVNKAKSVKSIDVWRAESDEKEFDALMSHIKKGGADTASIAYYKSRKDKFTMSA